MQYQVIYAFCIWKLMAIGNKVTQRQLKTAIMKFTSMKN